jgi:hypothetical protein
VCETKVEGEPKFWTSTGRPDYRKEQVSGKIGQETARNSSQIARNISSDCIFLYERKFSEIRHIYFPHYIFLDC